MRLFDTHCHLDIEDFDHDRDQVIADALSNGVTYVLIPAIAKSNFSAAQTLCRTHAGFYPALGLHPVFIDQHHDEHLDHLSNAITQERPTAIGEIGLDFAIKTLDKTRQISFFTAQLDIAAEHQLPVILHARKSHDEILKHLKAQSLTGGICHAFNGDINQAHRYLDLGFKLGFGGMLTYERSTKLRALAKALPDEAFVLETDAPDLTGAEHQYSRNSPAYLPEVAKSLAEIKGISVEEIAALTTANAMQVLSLTAD